MIHLGYMSPFSERGSSSSARREVQKSPEAPRLQAVRDKTPQDRRRSQADTRKTLENVRKLFAEEVEELPQEWLEEEPANDNAKPARIGEMWDTPANDNDQDAGYRAAAQDLYEAQQALAQTPRGDLFREELERRATDAQQRMNETAALFAQQNYRQDEAAWEDNPNLPHNQMKQGVAVPVRSPEEARRTLEASWAKKESLNQQVQALEDQIGEAVLRNNQYASDIFVKQQEVAQLHAQGGKSGAWGRFRSVFSGQEARRASEQLRLQEEALRGFERNQAQTAKEIQRMSARLAELRQAREKV